MALEVNGICNEALSYLFQRIQDNTTSSPIGTIDQYEPIIGTRINDLLVNFTAQASTLTYTGANTQMFRLSASFAWEAASTLSDVYKIAFFKNGTTLIGEVRALLDNALPYPRNTSLNAIVELAQNDTIECKVTNTETTQDIVIADMLLTANSLM
jgi:hypothetical protein